MTGRGWVTHTVEVTVTVDVICSHSEVATAIQSRVSKEIHGKADNLQAAAPAAMARTPAKITASFIADVMWTVMFD